MEPQINPYSPPKDVVDDPVLKPDLVRKLLSKVTFTFLWTLAFFFGSAMLLGFASGIYLVFVTSTGSKPSDQTLQWIGFSWATVPMVLGPIGFFLSILGSLPGTRWKSSS